MHLFLVLVSTPPNPRHFQNQTDSQNNLFLVSVFYCYSNNQMSRVFMPHILYSVLFMFFMTSNHGRYSNKNQFDETQKLKLILKLLKS